jgi:hypothetical protein
MELLGSPFVTIISFYFHLELKYPAYFVFSIKTKKVNGFSICTQDRQIGGAVSVFKLETCYFDPFLSAVTIGGCHFTSKSLPLFAPIINRGRNSGWKAQFNLYKERERIHRGLLTRDYYQFRVHEGELQPSIPTEERFDGIGSALRLGNPLSFPL